MTTPSLADLQREFESAKTRLAATVAHVADKSYGLDASHQVRLAIKQYVAARDAWFDAEDE